MAHTDHDHEEKKHDDEDEHLHVDEILLATLVLMAPDGVRKLLVDKLRAQVSIIAAEKAEELIKEIVQLEDVDKFLATAQAKLCPHLRGPTGERQFISPRELLETIFKKVESGEIPVTVARLNDKGEIHEVNPSTLVPEAFAEVTPNCNCPRCRHIKELESKGLRLRNDGSTVPFDRLN